ncbi:MAG: chorismate mutase [Chloroflexi bacterium]|nr:chorismate mutase [Chloroflexota bacterium]
MWVRGIRGATTVEHNTREEVLAATKELLAGMMKANDIGPDDVAFALFTTSPDLNAEFPAVAAREMGWLEVALMCTHEMDVPGGLPKCVRVMLLVNTNKKNSDIKFVYLKGAVNLRASVTPAKTR